MFYCKSPTHALVVTGVLLVLVEAWIVPDNHLARRTSARRTASPDSKFILNEKVNTDDNYDGTSASSSWSAADDWSSLSWENPENASPDSGTIFNQDLATKAAQELEAVGGGATFVLSEEDQWISGAVDEIHNSFPTLDDDHTPLYDTRFDEDNDGSTAAKNNKNSLDDMSNEIAMLVRCNEHPEELLISEGRALPPLTDLERNGVSPLVTTTTTIVDKDSGKKVVKFQATEFLTQTVAKMFHQHATADEVDGVLSLDRKGVAKWMTQSMQSAVSAHEKCVLKMLSDYSSYGSGRLVEEDFQHLYLSTIIGDYDYTSSSVTPARHLALRQPFIDAVWRDIRNHGFLSPVEQERKRLADEIHQAKNKNDGENKQLSHHDETIMDECEILDWDYSESSEGAVVAGSNPLDRKTASGSRNSHKFVEVAADKETPLWMRDGEFVFIDEESCIGCMQCANVAPNSFLMLESGRARTFKQRHSMDVNQAVESCPVSCMHPVTYRELKEYETARDEGDGRTDHKHMGHQRGHTPLHVAGMDSDNNHRSSWYHMLKGKCLQSSECPQKGCFDCPKYSKPGGNPYFQKREREAEHVRAQYFVEHGEVDMWRKAADL